MTNKEAIKYLQQFYPHGGHSWLDAQRMEAIKIAIDALQEEPVSEQNLSNVQRIGKNWKEPVSEPQVKESAKIQHVNETCKENGNSLTQEPVSEIDFEQELYKYFGQVKDFTLGMRIAKRFYEIGRNYQESVSEDLEEAASRYAKEEYSRKNPATLPDRCIGCYAPIMYAFKAGANWQKQKDEKNIGELQWNAHEEGWDECKQEMMAKAADVTIAIPYQNGYGGYTQLVDSKEALPFGENLKVLVVKEE